jgi:pimeloyl-ACP methyl ester carboxylesterase
LASDNTYLSPDGSITRTGRTIGFARRGNAGGPTVLWCHGGPGSRLAIMTLGPEADTFDNISIDRPGYGLSTPLPNRTIADFVPDALAVADHLGIEQFVVAGGSTGGAYAVATAALAPERVSAAVVYCGLSDMTDAPTRVLMTANRIQEIWAAPTRDAVIEVCRDLLGDDGGRMGQALSGASMAPADLGLISNPEFVERFMATVPASFTFGVEGYADDRIADGRGWGSFDPGSVRCPVVVLHGGSDTGVPVENAYLTAMLIPGAELRIFPDHGHFSIAAEVLPTLAELTR